ncbi:DUF294 nucleotidyltransferase-like domain-containing protein [Xanthobacter tagetidis]|uniref:CBS domain-containing protein n=1 Tax=Xanthobacter tagetidis TaxID=60216 RepID=A0A3L7AJ02_9HYPH|nr:DUF294 nucleotidyltransferase-like domain-containing protein [Xanthobacter tagetidis]MBB6309016.1 DNA polymerase-3 subunit epsilon/CBS domain-containing protein [Xanthobacter tagetidis]RLP80486.1 CBS domain-containing protein [Xanthobacter tagetidis]
MAEVLDATPLVGLDWLALDTETTGLDPRTARVLEIGVLPGRGVHSDAAAGRAIRVDPGVPIPEAATRVHGIDAAALKGADDFAHAWAQVAPLLGGRVLIGHTLGYDLAILARECAAAGIPFKAPRRLDVRLLAQLVRPDLANFSLDALAAFLEVAPGARHAALGDAETAARVFGALVPHLREGGIRTLAEAEAACRQLTEVLDAHYRAGYADPTVPLAEARADRALARIDASLYRHRVGDLMSPPLVVPAALPLSEAMAEMVRRQVGSLFVRLKGGEGPLALADAGIFTERDALRAVAASGGDSLGRPVGDFASHPLEAVPEDAFLYRAAGRMQRLKSRHLAVTGRDGIVCGALSVRDLLRSRASDTFSLDDGLLHGADAGELARAWARLPAVARALTADGVAAREVAAVISSELAALTARAAALAEAAEGPPPAPYAVLVLGSAGRGESLLAMDQDNAVVWAGPAEGADAWFARFGARLSDLLHEVGVPYCPGNVMARSPQWRGDAATWHARVAAWVSRARPDDLLSVDIFFDLAPASGTAAIADRLAADAYGAAAGQYAFLKQLADAGGPVRSALTLMGGLRTENGRVDVKAHGLFPIVCTARVLAIAHGIDARSTKARLDGLRAKGIGASADLEAMAEAHGVLLSAVLDQQLEDLAVGLPASNKVDPRRLDAHRRADLKEAFKVAAGAPDVRHTLLMA